MVVLEYCLAMLLLVQPGASELFSALTAMETLYRKDTCKAIYLPKKHGYDVEEYHATTTDNYRITLHRIIHPTDKQTRGPRPHQKKPYLLVHGLLGSSASFLRNVEQDYNAPDEWFVGRRLARDQISRSSSKFEYEWQSYADLLARPDWDKMSPISLLKEQTFGNSKRPLARLDEVDHDSDPSGFGRMFKQNYRKFQLPQFNSNAKPYLSNSLAFTLSNFGYDVWLINLRGNKYSTYYHGPKTVRSNSFWDFNLDTLALEDLPAGLETVRRVSGWLDPVGMVAYSYTCLHVMEMLSKLPHYQDAVQPVVLMAPTTMTSSGHKRRKVIMKVATKMAIPHSGPFPSLARNENDLIIRSICQLPVASKLCRLFEIFIHGEVKSVSGMIIDSHKSSLLKEDVDCGQTSAATLRQIVSNLASSTIEPKYKLSESRGLSAMPIKKPSVILMHSDSDDIANLEAVSQLKKTALRQNTLVDLVIQKPGFGHVDFLFSRHAKLLVNAEMARLVTLFDFMVYGGPPEGAPHPQIPG